MRSLFGLDSLATLWSCGMALSLRWGVQTCGGRSVGSRLFLQSSGSLWMMGFEELSLLNLIAVLSFSKLSAKATGGSQLET